MLKTFVFGMGIAFTFASASHAVIDVHFDSSTEFLEIDVQDTSNHDITVTVSSGSPVYVDVEIDSTSVKIYDRPIGTDGRTDIGVLASDVEYICVFGDVGEEVVDLTDVTSSSGYTNMDSSLVFLDYGNDEFYGSEFVDEVYGGAGDDYILGGDGDDLLQGDAGNDSIAGGNGDDQFWVGDVEVDLVTGDAGTDVLRSHDAGMDIVFSVP